jgi:TetR/AcrR family transcriptional regulator
MYTTSDTSSHTEHKIMQAATTIFLKKGKHGARMQEIAEVAGINKALLHYYFRSKEKLYQRVFRDEFGKFFSSLFSAIHPIDDIQQLLQTFVSSYIEQLYQNPRVVSFILWELQQGAESFKDIFKQVMTSHPDQGIFPVLQKIEQAIEQKQIQQVDPYHLIFSIVGMCIYIFIARPLLENIFPHINIMDPKFIEFRKKEVFNLVWNGLKPS